MLEPLGSAVDRGHPCGQRPQVGGLHVPRHRPGWPGPIGLSGPQACQFPVPDPEERGQSCRLGRQQREARLARGCSRFDEAALAPGHRGLAPERLVPWQRDVLRSEQFSQGFALGHATCHRAGPGVEPDVAEGQAERAVVEQQRGTADMVVVDVADDGQVDVALAPDVCGDPGQARLQRREGFVGAGIDEQPPRPIADRTTDQQAVTIAGGEDLQRNGGSWHVRHPTGRRLGRLSRLAAVSRNSRRTTTTAASPASAPGPSARAHR